MQDIVNETLKLLDEFSNSTASIDTNILNRIDGQINRCYYELAERDLVSSYMKISQFPVENMLGETFSYDTHTTTAVTYTQASAYAYYFETDGNCLVDIQEASSNGVYTTLSTLTVTGVSSFTLQRGFVTALVSSDNIRLSFYGNSVYTIRNVAFYPYTFGNSTASIPSFTPYCEYSLPSDYMDINRVTYRYNSDYGPFTDYRIENGKLLISRGYSSEFIFNYYRQVSALTTATNTFEILDKSALIIPYGVAGTILVGNGYNVKAGQQLLAMYEAKKNGIDVSNEYGNREIVNEQGW